MAKMTKRAKALEGKVDGNKFYPVVDALTLAKATATAKFNESIDVAINLGIDAKKSDQTVRGSVVMPSGTGKTVRVAVFAQGAKAEEAKAAGADVVGFEDLAERVKGGFMEFDVVIASPDAMRVVGTLGQVLGPRGLMPNPKAGTVVQPDGLENAIKELKAGRVEFRNDKTGNLHVPVGKASFDVNKIAENAQAILDAVQRNRPSTVKGLFFKRLVVTSTMGPSIKVEIGGQAS